MIITGGRILGKELQITYDDLIKITTHILWGENVRIKGLNGDVVFHAKDPKGQEHVIEVEELTC